MTQQWNSAQTSVAITLSGTPVLTATQNTNLVTAATYGLVSVTSSTPPLGGNVGYYFEITIAGPGFTTTTDFSAIGWGNVTSPTTSIGNDFSTIGWYPDGTWYTNNVSVGAAPPFNWSSGTLLCCVAVDVVNNLIYGRLGIGGNWNNSGTANPATQTGGVSITQSGMTITSNAMVPCAGLYMTSPSADSAVAAFASASWQGVAPNKFGPFSNDCVKMALTGVGCFVGWRASLLGGVAQCSARAIERNEIITRRRLILPGVGHNGGPPLDD